MKLISSTRFQTTLGFLGLLFSANVALSSPIPGNLGSGLDILVKERVAKAAIGKGAAKGVDPGLIEQAQSYRDMAFVKQDERVKVYIHLSPLNGTSPLALPKSAEVTATDMTYFSGVIEAYISLDDVSNIARNPRVNSVILAIKPILDVGAATSQGVVQHRIATSIGAPPADFRDLVTQDGTGVTVGLMSDSFNALNGYATDQGTGDLPGPSNTAGNLTPVQVLDDPIADGSDEGRAMAQIVHDMAPKARLGFATASVGQVSFADNIRSLAGLASGSHMVPGFAARVIVDDLFYSDSPMFGTSLVGRAINEVAGAPTNVSYFSSAGNRPAAQGYFSDFRFVSSANLATALAGTNIPASAITSNIPAAFYAGGFHNFRTDGTQDVAQTVSSGNSGSASAISCQWDDPYDVDPPPFNPTPFFTGSGSIPGTTNFPLNALTAAVQYRVAVTDPGDAADVVVEVLDPSGNVMLHQDTGFNEVVFFFAPVSGNYVVRVMEFPGADPSPYDVKVFVASGGTPRITVDYNLFFFRSDTGAFVRMLSANSFATNQPLEIGTFTPFPAGQTTMQLIIARANTPPANNPSKKIRYVMTGAVAQAAEYFDYQTPITFGHNHEPGDISVGAYNPWRPFQPEDFTSPGPSYIYFDQNGVRLATPIVRQKPDVSALDGGNNTFFGSDDARDTDGFSNFFGTSAAAPHAAGIAALVLQAHGGSVTQPQMRTILQRAGFLHDLDPLYSIGTAKAAGQKITITARGNAGTFNNSDTRNLSVDDTRSFGVSYVGPGSVANLTINLAAANPNGGDVALGAVPGLVWDNRALLPRGADCGFSFAVGQVFGAFVPGNVSAVYSLPAPAPAVPGQNFQLDLTFTAGALSAGNSFTFGADRDEAHTASLTPLTARYGNSPDLLGAGVAIPQNTITSGGATLTGTFASPASGFSGTFTNVIGQGYSTLDGFGFINAESAVNQPVP